MDPLHVNDGAPPLTPPGIDNSLPQGIRLGCRRIEDLHIEIGVDVILGRHHLWLELLIEFGRRILFSLTLGVLQRFNEVL